MMPMTATTVYQIANLIKTAKSSFCIEKLPGQQQIGTSDCALYAIGFAVEFRCLQTDATKICFDQKECVGIYLNAWKKEYLHHFQKQALLRYLSVA